MIFDDVDDHINPDFRTPVCFEGIRDRKTDDRSELNCQGWRSCSELRHETLSVRNFFIRNEQHQFVDGGSIKPPSIGRRDRVPTYGVLFLHDVQ
jgi:hypothetical protein